VVYNKPLGATTRVFHQHGVYAYTTGFQSLNTGLHCDHTAYFLLFTDMAADKLFQQTL